MTSFQIAISPSRRAAGRFISRVRRSLQRALVEEGELTGINQSRVADAIGVHRSVISRELNGLQDITLGRVAELAWAMGREIEFELLRPEHVEGCNVPFVRPGALTSQELEKRKVEPSSTPEFDRQLEVSM
jgi:predicted XRE-type DNA-binding protein